MTARGAAGWQRWAQAGMVVVALAPISGCKQVKATSADGYRPANVAAASQSAVKQVTFTAEAARRVGLRTETAVASGPHTVISYAALLYDGKGVTWVYTTPAPLTFLRAKVVVDRIEGDRVLLSHGLRAGTDVVTVGATEVYGAELYIAGSH